MAKRKSGGKSSGKPKATKNIDDNGSIDDEEYEVEKVIHHRKFSSGGLEYLIRWKGYGPDDDTWEKESNLTSSAVLIAEYKEANKVSSDEEIEDDSEDKTNGKENKSDAEDDIEDNDNADDDDFDAAPAKKKKKPTPAKKGKGKTAAASKSKGRGRPKGTTKEEAKKKTAAKKKSKKDDSDDNDDDDEGTEEYEVEKIIEVHNGKHGKEYLVRWKGFSSKDDTWEPEEHLTCPDLIKQFNDKLGKIKGVTPKSLRTAPAKTNRLSVQNSTPSGRHSKRFVGKRKSYAEDE